MTRPDGPQQSDMLPIIGFCGLHLSGPGRILSPFGGGFFANPHAQLKGGFNETSSIHKDRTGARRCCRRGRRAGHRAVDAGAQVAADVELPEIARHALWRGRDAVETRSGSDRQQIPNSMLRRWRNRSAVPGCRRGGQQHRRDVPHRRLLFHRQGSDLRAVQFASVRAELAPAKRLVPGSRRPGHAQ